MQLDKQFYCIIFEKDKNNKNFLKKNFKLFNKRKEIRRKEKKKPNTKDYKKNKKKII